MYLSAAQTTSSSIILGQLEFSQTIISKDMENKAKTICMKKIIFSLIPVSILTNGAMRELMFQLHNPKHPLVHESCVLIQMLFPKSQFLLFLIGHAAAKQLCCLPSHTHKCMSTSIYVPQITCHSGQKEKKTFISQGQQLLDEEHLPQTLAGTQSRADDEWHLAESWGRLCITIFIQIAPLKSYFKLESAEWISGIWNMK